MFQQKNKVAQYINSRVTFRCLDVEAAYET
mgnify:FL=1